MLLHSCSSVLLKCSWDGSAGSASVSNILAATGLALKWPNLCRNPKETERLWKSCLVGNAVLVLTGDKGNSAGREELPFGTEFPVKALSF